MPSGAPGGPQEDPIPNIPTVAIVDKENLRGQARRILGAKARPTVGGVVDGLARYGFGVREVHVSVALAKRKADEGKSEHRENAAFVARVEADRRGKLIKGLLQWDRTGGQPPKEKGVDVGIALAVVRQSLAIADGDSQFKAIALLCDDTDLAPAVDFAHELNVPCIVVGTDERLRYRGQPWCLLTDEVLAQVCAQRADLTGSALRARLANAVLNGTQLEEYEPDARGKGLARAGIGPDDPVGLPVLVPPGVDVRAVPRTPLTPTGIVWDRDKFPMITCADSTPLVEAKVVARLGDKLKVEIASAMVKVDAPRGLGWPGDHVLLSKAPGSSGWQMVGVSRPVARPYRTSSPFMTEVTEVISPGRVIAIQTTNGRAWQLDLKGVPAEVGQRFAALAIDGPRGLRRHPLAQPISSALPQE